MRVRELFGALAERDFRLLWLGQTTSMLGNSLVPVALAFAVLELTGSASDLGLVLAAETAPLVIFLLVGGVWADRLPRQLVMVASDVVRGGSQAGIAVLLLTGRAEIWMLVVLAAVFGTAAAFFQPAYTGVVPATVKAERLQQANGLLAISNSSAAIAGPALAGIFVATVGPWLAFVVDAATFSVSAVSLLALSLPRTIRRIEAPNFLRELAGGWHELVTHTWLWTIVLWAATYLFFVVAPLMVLGPLVAKESLGGAGAWAGIASAWSAGSLLGGVVALRWKPARPMLVCCLLVFWTAVPLSLFALAAPAPLIGAAQLGSGVCMGFFGAVWNTTLQQHVPEDKLSRVSAYDWMGSLVLLPVGFAVAGPVAEAIGVAATFWVAVGWVVVSTAAILLVRDVRSLRRRDAAPGEEAPLPAPAPARGPLVTEA